MTEKRQHVRPILFGASVAPNVDWDFSDADIAYLLGVIHGDGHVAKRSVSISVSYREQAYADILVDLLRSLGFDPKVYRARTALRVDVHNAALAERLRKTKSAGLWTIPSCTRATDYLAGIIDTDGHLTKPPSRAIVITLKRSGNLTRLSRLLADAGLRMPAVKDRTTSFRGSRYEIEELKWPAIDQVDWIASNVRLRHPRKAARLAGMKAEIIAIRAHVPLWRLIAEWLSDQPRDIAEIMDRWSLTRAQADSALGNIKLNCDVEAIPPPRTLMKYRVRRPGNDA